MRLLLLRHGQTPSNVIGALDTAKPGAPLNALGERQAHAVPVALADESIQAIYVSTLIRTQLTGQPLANARGIVPTVLDGLREIEAGSLEMLSDPRSQGIYTATAFAWARGDLDLRMPGGEDGHEFFARYDDAMSRILDSGGQTVVAVSHGAAIRTWVAARCENLDGSFAGSHQLDNTGFADLEGDVGRRWRLSRWNSAPIGGTQLKDSRAIDPAGEGLERTPRGSF